MFRGLPGSGTVRVATIRWLCRTVSPFATTAEVMAGLPVDWRLVILAAGDHSLLPSLRSAFIRHGLEAHAPTEVSEALEAYFAFHRARNECLRAQMLQVTRALNAAGLVPIWLKGAVRLLDPGWAQTTRSMGDLDFYIADPADQKTTLEVLSTLGYRAQYKEENWKVSHHFPPMIHKDWPVTLEVHRNIVSNAYELLLSDREALAAVVDLGWEGSRAAHLASRHQAMHSLIQASLMSHPPMRYGQIRFNKMLDFVELIVAGGNPIRDEIAERVARSPWSDPIAQIMTMIEAYFGLPNPLATAPGYLRRMERRLRFPPLGTMETLAAMAIRPGVIRNLARPFDWLKIVRSHLDAAGHIMRRW